MNPNPSRNRLVTESSAYLLQHASNPVDWYPWGDEALQLARRLDRPILLSIGYSACHWCHVMERESFENPDIAALMNEHFVCIKVDREERPDLDHLYMKALQGMTGRGGWPMTMFLTPDARPFYAGTYFPPEDRAGMPGFPRVLLGVSKTWAEKPADVSESAARVVAFLAGESNSESGHFDETTIGDCAQSLVAAMDSAHGGFGRAPKFPGTMALSLLMEAEIVTGDPIRRELVRLTLDRMAAGGIRDHLGGGFHRYSVDQVWLVPHFEKMLYDQALLANLYTDASRLFVDRGYADVAEEILDYVVREMTSAEGGFFSAQDADSEGEEGKFFVWSRAEILEVLGEERSAAFCEAYGVTDEGNFEGRNILHRVAPRIPADGEAELKASRELLLRRRRERIPPGTDRKIVTDWNGLMISAMAAGGQVLAREDLVEAAVRAAEFVRATLLDANGLKHVFAGGSARISAFLDDYAFFGRACLDLFGVRPRPEFLATAVTCAERLLAEFADREGGAFWFSGSRGENLVARTCDLHDGAVPSGNSVAAELLLRLWSLTGEDRYRAAGQTVIDRFLAGALRNVYGSSHILAVVERARRGWRTVVLVGEAAARERLSRAARDVYDPGCTVIALESQDLDWYPSALRGKSTPTDGACAYVCEGSTCTMPLVTAEELSGALRPGTSGR